MQQAYLYKLAVKDTQGQISALSPHHKTIHLTINSGIGGAWNLIWNHYEGINLSSYNIYRGTHPDTMTLLTTVSASLDSYSDLTPPAGTVYYKISVINSDGCTPTAKTENYSESESNVVDNIVAGIANRTMLDDISIYPNPTNGDFTIQLDNNSVSDINIYLFNSFGQEIYQTKLIGSKLTLSMAGLPKGIYFLRVGLEKESVVKTVVID